MEWYGKSEEVATRILSVFQSGKLPAALAPLFIRRRDNTPCRSWSWSNQLLTALAGYSDARSYLDWQRVGRQVRKGERAFHILEPVRVKKTVRDSGTGEESDRLVTVGFKAGARFGLDQTDVAHADKWAEADKANAEARQFIDGLPLVSVARSWNLSVETYSGEGARFAGYYRHGCGIALGVKNPATWAHELCHAADDRNGKLTKRAGQQLDNEVVAELGGAVLLRVLGHDYDADLGGCWQYVQRCCERAKKQPIAVCQKLLNRVCEAVALILDTANKLRSPAPGEPADTVAA